MRPFRAPRLVHAASALVACAHVACAYDAGMPELPDVTVYGEAIARRVVGSALERVRVDHPFLLRSVDPPLTAFQGRVARAVERLGKRIVLRFDDELALVVHLMIAGRFQWSDAGRPARKGLAAFVFASGTLVLTEAGSKRRASLVAVRGDAALRALDRGGLEPIGASRAAFTAALTRENRTLKRALTDPRLFAGIGNAYSDEILHAARLSPLVRTHDLAPDAIERLWRATDATLAAWTERLRREYGDAFPTKVTAFRPDMAVHGRFGLPCPACGAKVQRIVWSETECNYCAACQTGGRLLADRALSRVLHDDWPKSLDELDEARGR